MKGELLKRTYYSSSRRKKDDPHGFQGGLRSETLLLLSLENMKLDLKKRTNANCGDIICGEFPRVSNCQI